VKVLKKSILCCVVATILALSLGAVTFAAVEVPPAEMYAEKQMIFDYLDQPQIFERYGKMSDAIWSYAELGLREFKSSKLVADNLEKEGFKVERGVAGMPTAFVASYGSGKPMIGFIAEYDALPMLSQKGRVPYKEGLVEGAPGHGCGHNQQGPASSAAAIAVKQVMDKYGIRGTVKVFGCPSEETVISRPYMVRAGLFNGMDAVLKTHGGSSFGGGTLGGISGNALWSVVFTFKGKTGHSASSPWKARSALDAVDIMNVSTNFLREHLFYSYRLHYVITKGGEAPNVVPDNAAVWYFVRNSDDLIESDFARVVKCAEGAAIATETEMSYRILTAIHQSHNNAAIIEIGHRNTMLVGMPEWSDEEQAFAKALQKELGKPEIGMPTELGTLREWDPDRLFVGGGSTDLAEVKLVVPLGDIRTPGTVPGDEGHHWSRTAGGFGSANWKGINAAAKAMAATALDLMTMPEELKKVQDEFAIQAEEYPYSSYMPADAVPPLEMNEDLMGKWRPKMEATYLEP